MQEAKMTRHWKNIRLAYIIEYEATRISALKTLVIKTKTPKDCVGSM